MNRRPAPISPEILARLRAAGIPMPGDQDDDLTEPDIIIEVTRPAITRACSLRVGAEFVFGISIKNQSYSPVRIEKLSVEMEWRSKLVLLCDPRLYSPKTPVYRLKSGKKYPCAEVLNHRVGARGLLEPGETVEGVLLAFDIAHEIPAEYLHGSNVSSMIRATDHFGREHSEMIEIIVDRSATQRPILMHRTGAGLYAREDASASVMDESRRSGGLVHGEHDKSLDANE